MGKKKLYSGLSNPGVRGRNQVAVLGYSKGEYQKNTLLKIAGSGKKGCDDFK